VRPGYPESCLPRCGRRLLRRRPSQQDRKNIAVDPGQAVTIKHDVNQACGDELEKTVSRMPAEGIIDDLKPFEVNQHQRHNASVVARATDLLREAVVKRARLGRPVSTSW